MTSFWTRIADALRYYEQQGFRRLDFVPWTVSCPTSVLTKPQDRQDYFFRDKVLVGSAEQSFLELILAHQPPKQQQKDASSFPELKPGKYVTCTPCFRDEPVEDALHQIYFIKVELIEFQWIDKNHSDILPFHHDPQKSLDSMIANAQQFFRRYSVVAEREQTEEGCDLVVRIPTSDHSPQINAAVEIGSYGIRELNVQDRQLVWIYGTGLAEPRFSFVLNHHPSLLPGYHVNQIPRGVLGQLSKIREELEEAEDAEQQHSKIMTLVELSDLYGALEQVVSHQFQMTIDDLARFSRITRRAFESGRRMSRL